jgi:hypothetical protein
MLLLQVEPRLAGGNAERDPSETESLEYFRQATSRPFLAAGGFSRASAVEAVKDGKADAIVFGECCSQGLCGQRVAKWQACLGSSLSVGRAGVVCEAGQGI